MGGIFSGKFKTHNLVSGTWNTDEKDEALEEISWGWIREGTEALTVSSVIFLKNSDDGNMKNGDIWYILVWVSVTLVSVLLCLIKN